MFIKSYCRITNHSIVLDGQRQETLGKFLNGHHVSEDLDNVFEQLDADYPAFLGWMSSASWVLLRPSC